jgi:hypothetical protein
MPVLEHIKKTHPHINIVIDDFSDCIHTELTEADFFTSNHYQSMLTFFRFNRRSAFEQEQIDKNKTVGVVYGYDKIKCSILDNSFYAYFTDNMGGAWQPDRNIEFFYWTPDFPSIPVLQAHSILDFLTENRSSDDKNYNQLYKTICCPDYNPDTFQVLKPKGSMVWKSDNWVNQYSPGYYKSWAWTCKQFFPAIDKQYISRVGGIQVGIMPCSSPRYIVSTDVNISSDLLPDTDRYYLV